MVVLVSFSLLQFQKQTNVFLNFLDLRQEPFNDDDHKGESRAHEQAQENGGMLPFTPQKGLPTGILSNKPASFFKSIQEQTDSMPLAARCRQYGFLKKDPSITNSSITAASRRMFYGSLIADEPWELLEIVTTETYGLFSAVVLVESNRTQHFSPRPLQRVGQEETLKEMFGTSQLQLRNYVNEDPRILDLWREHEQRQEILKGWKEMGMGPSDVGYLADTDETFSRDFLRAIQQCPDIEFFDHKIHHCNPFQARIVGAAQVFEASPDCVTRKRVWHHPDLIAGACIEGIGDESVNPIAPRDFFVRAEGYGGHEGRPSCSEEGLRNIKDNRSFPLYNAADFRNMCGGKMIRNKATDLSEYTSFHFHNFFANFNQTRFKYKTYGHPQAGAYTRKLEDIHEDLELVVRCAHNLSTKRNGTKIRERVNEGLIGTPKPWPIYFHDEDYRKRKAKSLRDEVIADEAVRQAFNKDREAKELERRAKLLKNSKALSF